ncbi:MAG: sugar phosphate isomerase/epimerase [Cyclobacteriaceae bacterium]|nr:sugar phosphate isomerase/epimerase [Cyclobacteriaceae bacterium]
MSDLHRRDFLKAAAIPVAASLGFSNLSSAVHVNAQHSSAISRAKIKVSLNAWSYNVPLYKYINGQTGGMSLFDLLEECARLDFEAVDATGYFFPGYPDVPDQRFINEFKRRAFQLGLAISGTGIRNDFATSDPLKRKADVALAKRWIEVAAAMGAPVIRVFAGKQPEGHSWDATAEWMAESLAECADYGAQFGVMVGVQNHGDMLQTADEVIKIMHMVQSDWLGAIVDTGYFLTSNPYDDIERVIPYAVNWQVKELLNGRKGGRIDLHRLVGIIRKSNYRGYVPIETLAEIGQESSYDPYIKVPELLKAFREALG